jgi:hypothetical protein
MSETRRTVRIFFASSNEMAEERDGFAAAIERIGEMAGIRRNYVLDPVQWETDAFGGAFDDIDKTIQSATDFDTLDIVVIGVWNRIGPGTQGEYERARSLFRIHRRPEVLVFVRKPKPEAEPDELEKILAFKQRLIAEGVVPNEYRTQKEFFQRLEEQIAKIFVRYPQRLEPTPILALRKRFIAAAMVTFGLSVAAVVVCQVMTIYHGMNYWNVLLVLAFPLALSLGGLFSHWYYHRLLTALKGVWHSPSFTDEELYEAFRDLMPRFAVPPVLEQRFRQSNASMALTLLLLALAFFSPVIAQYQCLFEEMAYWHFAVGHDVVTLEGKPEVAEGRLVRNLYVDERKDGSWPFGLQDPAARAKYESGDEIIYVYAQGTFHSGDGLSNHDLFRRNLGPQVWLPQQFLIYLALLVAAFLAGVLLFFRLARFRKELRTIVEQR